MITYNDTRDRFLIMRDTGFFSKDVTLDKMGKEYFITDTNFRYSNYFDNLYALNKFFDGIYYYSYLLREDI